MVTAFLIVALSSLLQIKANQDTGIDYQNILDMSLEELINAQVVTAAKKSEKVGDIPASAVIITREELKKHG